MTSSGRLVTMGDESADVSTSKDSERRPPNGFATAGGVVGAFSVVLPPSQYGNLENFLIGMLGVLAIVLSGVGLEYTFSTRTRVSSTFFIVIGIVAGILDIHRMRDFL